MAQILERMNAAQITRGPNGSGVVTSGKAGVGMVRLRVRAEQSEAEPIPISTEHTAAYNGEIYWSGDAVPSGGAGEVLALCEDKHGAPDGMYAMVRLDHASQSLDLWRDPFGIKPMWSRSLPGGVAIASSIDSLLHGFGSGTPRFDGVQQFLTFGRPIDGGSMLEDIASVPRGRKLRLAEGVCTHEQRIALNEPRAGADPRDPRALRAALQTSIRRVLPSNRTMGLAVSGGLDSTILAHQMAEIGIEDLRTVSVLVEGVEDGISDLSQLQIPDKVAQSWSHSTITVTPEMFARGFERAARDLGEPTRLSSVPLYGALADVAQEAGIVVLQVGEGADELFMGYSSYRNLDPQSPDFHFDFMVPKARRPYIETLYGPEAIAQCRKVFDRTYPTANDVSPFENLRRTELDHSLEPLLRRSDQILMSRSIEGRTPFLHGDVPQLALMLDAAEHLEGTASKPMLRAAFPELDRLEGPWRTKTPFRAPVTDWLRTCLTPWMERTLDEGTDLLRGFGLREKGIALIRRDASNGEAAALDMALALMSLVFWADWLAKDRVHV
jgi:asparagine synthase (glutamine-hydrolysing)